jgi:hypothetical protein
MHIEGEKIVRPDAKGRIFLGKMAEGVSSYRAYMDEDHRVILEPFAEIPLRERWLFENKEAYESVQRGMADAKAGRVAYLGDFSKYIEEND